MNVLARQRLLVLVTISLAGAIALYPVIGNGFLVITFDDGGFILENPYLRAFTWANIWACLSRFYLYDYLPLPMLSYLAEFQLWGLEPAGYHTVNLLLHLVAAMLVYAVGARALHSERAGAFAGLVFALHPVQVESVSLIAQRKTLLATAFLLGSLRAYQRYSDGHRRSYTVACLCYLAACASKSTVVPFPFLLLLYDYVFQRTRLSLRDKLPFFALSLATAAVNLASKAGSEVVKAPQGGNYLSTALVMSRVFWEYAAALLLPVNLSPTYYYSPREIFGLTNWLAAATGIMAIIAVLCWRHRLPLTFFFVGWAGFSLLPVSNIVPIADVRADRYLYLPMAGFALWAGFVLAAGEEWWAGFTRGWRVPRATLPCLTFVLLGVLSWQYTHVWRSDVTAWTRVLERHPWNSRAHYLLACAYAQRQEWEPARRLAAESVRIDPDFDRARELLADLSRHVAPQAAPPDPATGQGDPSAAHPPTNGTTAD